MSLYILISQKNRTIFTRWTSVFGLCLCCICGGCGPTRSNAIDTIARDRMLALLMPNSIEIVSPFTRLQSVQNDNNVSDNMEFELELLLRASNALDNPGLMIVGNVRIELFEHIQATGNPKGRQLARWIVPLNTATDQHAFWNPVTQMYEFRLGLNQTDIPSAVRYVVSVTYNSPMGDHLTDEEMIDVRTFRRTLSDAGRTN